MSHLHATESEARGELARYVRRSSDSAMFVRIARQRRVPWTPSPRPRLWTGYPPTFRSSEPTGRRAATFFASSTTSWESTIKSAGSFVVDCDDGGSHVDITRLTRLGPSAWQFFKDHPFKIGSPDPYKAVPSGFPTYGKIL
jgi:hypothetical protein